MKYYKINYNKLENLHQINYFKFIFLIILSCNVSSYHTLNIYGIYKDDLLHIKTNILFSEAVKTSEYVIFDNKKIKYKIDNFGDYEIVNNEIYQNIDLHLDKKFYDNEVGLFKLHYHKEKLIKFIFKLFK